MLPFVFVNSILDHLLYEGAADWFCASVVQHVSIFRSQTISVTPIMWWIKSMRDLGLTLGLGNLVNLTKVTAGNHQVIDGMFVFIIRLIKSCWRGKKPPHISLLWFSTCSSHRYESGNDQAWYEKERDETTPPYSNPNTDYKCILVGSEQRWAGLQWKYPFRT